MLSHEISDVKKIKSVLKKSKLLVRVNPIFEGSKDEIDSVIEYGADIVMLPFLKPKKKLINSLVMSTAGQKPCFWWKLRKLSAILIQSLAKAE